MSAASSAERRPSRRSAQPTCPIWRRRDRGIRGTRGMGSRRPRPTPPGLQGRVIVRRRPPSRGPAPPLPPRIRFGTREGMKNDGLGPLGMHFFYPPEERQRGRFLTLRQKRSFYREEREGAKRGSSPSLPKGSRFLSPSIRLNLGLSRRSLFQWPVASSSRETSA